MNRIQLRRAILRLQFLRWLRFALWHFSCRQLPWSLFLERQREQLAQRQFLLVAKCRDANRDLALRNVAAQAAMDLVPPAKDRAPVRIGLALDNRMMNPMHPRRDDDVIENPLQA